MTRRGAPLSECLLESKYRSLIVVARTALALIATRFARSYAANTMLDILAPAGIGRTASAAARPLAAAALVPERSLLKSRLRLP
jgi:hypothetical protein